MQLQEINYLLGQRMSSSLVPKDSESKLCTLTLLDVDSAEEKGFRDIFNLGLHL